MPHAIPEAPDLPRPFYGRPFPWRLRDDARALWDWHAGLARADVPALDGHDLTAFFEAECDSAEAGEPLRSMPEDVSRRAYRACEEHALPRGLLIEQVMPARRLQASLRFETADDLEVFVRRWATPLALLLARLAGAGHSWQERPLHELARGFFLAGRLARLPQDVVQDRLFIPTEDLEQAGVSLDKLRSGEMDEDVRRLLWKQTVRVRDALAQGQQALVSELPGRYARALKRSWLGALEVLNEIERRSYDLWSASLQLSTFRRVQVRLQALLGRAASAG